MTNFPNPMDYDEENEFFSDYNEAVEAWENQADDINEEK